MAAEKFGKVKREASNLHFRISWKRRKQRSLTGKTRKTNTKTSRTLLGCRETAGNRKKKQKLVTRFFHFPPFSWQPDNLTRREEDRELPEAVTAAEKQIRVSHSPISICCVSVFCPPFFFLFFLFSHSGINPHFLNLKIHLNDDYTF